ncbi:hypothetical protein MGYG_06455 [Nannizzia gypsea CBS 118893]|uniref:Uncharacterized protein n=1 Tax=Arthroderma gypseum (strain ATCC MYA-4604 / CBS 118893) TaxID=535722 RepID=E4UZC7_ARTGP|nr:hypothetical protein MGYG_06455 [Nannizzia gypsea CBS 118893]EFR03457.1 hypothetical protein MGYG_06455 [Nannizzia gypsea CBS 118893]
MRDRTISRRDQEKKKQKKQTLVKTGMKRSRRDRDRIDLEPTRGPLIPLAYEVLNTVAGGKKRSDTRDEGAVKSNKNLVSGGSLGLRFSDRPTDRQDSADRRLVGQTESCCLLSAALVAVDVCRVDAGKGTRKAHTAKGREKEDESERGCRKNARIRGG